jgi:putative FmdB family regulatory protein
MPIYEYRRADGTTFELLQKFTDEALTVDPETGEPVQRVFHAPAIHFKGKGFHNTDYGTRRRNRELEKSAEGGASDHADKSAAKSDGAASDGSGSDGAKASASDGKPAPPADAKPAAKAKKAEKAA